MCAAGAFDSGAIAVIIEYRDGAHTGEAEYAHRYVTPSRASASIVGVRASGSPYAPTKGLLSSLMSHSTFGRRRDGAAGGRAVARPGMTAAPRAALATSRRGTPA